jgi:hypothetical protein
MEYLFWALAGWCGTPWPRRWPPLPWPPGPDPDPVYKPQPDPWVILKVIGVVGGIIGGLIFDRVFEGGPLPARSLGWIAATSFGGLIVGRVLSEVVSFALGAARPNTPG